MIFLFLLSLFEKLLANPRNLSKYTDIHCTAIQKKMPLLFLHFASASFIRVTSYINFTALSQFKFPPLGCSGIVTVFKEHTPQLKRKMEKSEYLPLSKHLSE